VLVEAGHPSSLYPYTTAAVVPSLSKLPTVPCKLSTVSKLEAQASKRTKVVSVRVIWKITPGAAEPIEVRVIGGIPTVVPVTEAPQLSGA